MGCGASAEAASARDFNNSEGSAATTGRCHSDFDFHDACAVPNSAPAAWPFGRDVGKGDLTTAPAPPGAWPEAAAPSAGAGAAAIAAAFCGCPRRPSRSRQPSPAGRRRVSAATAAAPSAVVDASVAATLAGTRAGVRAGNVSRIGAERRRVSAPPLPQPLPAQTPLSLEGGCVGAPLSREPCDLRGLGDGERTSGRSFGRRFGGAPEFDAASPSAASLFAASGDAAGWGVGVGDAPSPLVPQPATPQPTRQSDWGFFRSRLQAFGEPAAAEPPRASPLPALDKSSRRRRGSASSSCSGDSATTRTFRSCGSRSLVASASLLGEGSGGRGGGCAPSRGTDVSPALSPGIEPCPWRPFLADRLSAVSEGGWTRTPSTDSRIVGAESRTPPPVWGR